MNALKRIKSVSKSLFFKSLNLPYPNTKGYAHFEDVAYGLSWFPASCANLTKQQAYTSGIFSTGSNFFTDILDVGSRLIQAPAIPVWYLNKNLYDSFKNTSLPNIEDVDLAVLPYGIIMLPNVDDADFTDPNGLLPNWLGFSFSPKGEHRSIVAFSDQLMRFNPHSCDEFRVFTAILYPDSSKVNKVNLDGYCLTYSDAEYEDRWSYNMASNFIADKEFNEEDTPEAREHFAKIGAYQEGLKSIVIQTLLYLQTRPEDVTPINPYSLAPVEPKQAKKGGKKRYTPLMIGKQFKPRTETVSLGGTHASPRTHWRRGHWRRVAIGEGRGERKWHWFQPVLVNG